MRMRTQADRIEFPLALVPDPTADHILILEFSARSSASHPVRHDFGNRKLPWALSIPTDSSACLELSQSRARTWPRWLPRRKGVSRVGTSEAFCRVRCRSSLRRELVASGRFVAKSHTGDSRCVAEMPDAV
jgi:hypothetical protein